MKNKLKYIWFVLLLLCFATLMIHFRMNKPKQLRENTYSQWSSSFIIPLDDMAYIQTEKNGGERVTLSEAQGYGMLIAAKAGQQNMANQGDFEKLYNYYLTNRLPNSELMSWKQTIRSTGKMKQFRHNATDGDLYIAYALLQASKVWPKEADRYKGQAEKLLAEILRRNYNSKLNILTVGDWATEDAQFSSLMRTSDVMPQQFDEFYQLTKDTRWLQIKQTMVEKLLLMSGRYKTGLLPDFMWVGLTGVEPAKPNAVATKFDGTYSYNACRVPYHLAQSQDTHSQLVLEKMMAFFMKKNRIQAGYELNGNKLHHYQASSFLAPIFFAAQKKEAYNKLVQQNKFIFMGDLSKENYYEMALLTMVALDSLDVKAQVVDKVAKD